MHHSPLTRIPGLLCKLSVLLAVFSAFACGQSRQLPEQELHPTAVRGPQQSPLTMQPFVFEYENQSFYAEPRAYYELAGLLVSHNNVTSISDAYHDRREVAFRDLCIVWGENLVSGVYRRLTFWSEPWSCHVRSDNREDYDLFRPNQLSNTHMLTANLEVRDKVRRAKRGDQIWARGVLVDYCPQGATQFTRRSSLTRDDTGDGACEVLFIDQFKVLAPTSSPWQRRQELAWQGALIFAVASLLSWLCMVYFQDRRRSAILDVMIKKQKARRP